MSDGYDDPKVVRLDVVTALPLAPGLILEEAKRAGLAEVVVVGCHEDGSFYFASSVGDAANVIYHLSKGMHRLHRKVEEMEGGSDG